MSTYNEKNTKFSVDRLNVRIDVRSIEDFY